MGNDLDVEFVFGKEEGKKRLEKKMLESLLSAVASDLYQPAEIEKFCQKVYSELNSEKKIGYVEIIIPKLYWFGVYAYEENGMNFSFIVQDTFTLDETAMSDFSRRVRSAFELMKPWYGYAETHESLDEIWEAYKEKVKPHAHTCWINYYSPRLVNELGRDKLLSAAKSVAEELGDVTIEELVDGAVILQTGKLPGHVDTAKRIKAIESRLFGKPCKYDEKRV